ncbi:acyl-CoA dehydrogenase family protein [Rhodococcoides fascians]|uniref:acyl-CoA dehydrogenase family protein n=1 Tax=Rhodococcoides fascians TaxID=1828 RepID=UPI00069163B4|nr:acyl-CoA dehydrogenase family protein [Rhodococcus fascians]
MATETSSTEGHAEFRGVFRKMLGARTPVSTARSAYEGAATSTPTLWKAFADEIGILGLTIPESLGGSGLERAELAIVAEEMGRVLAGGPYFSTVVLAAEAITASGDTDAAAQYLPRIAAGELTAALAVVERTGGWTEQAIHTTATTDADGIRLSGSKGVVVGGADADLLVVAARDNQKQVSLFLVDPLAAGVTRAPQQVIDRTRPAARIDFADAPATRLGAPGTGWTAVEAVLENAAIFLAAEQVGGSQVCLDMAVAYAKDRVQFGQKIGRFQGVKHRLADMAVRTEIARSAVQWAAYQPSNSSASDLGAGVARATCIDTYLQNALDCIQVHGGIAITWEHDSHLFLRRAQADAAILPGARDYRRKLEAHIAHGKDVA